MSPKILVNSDGTPATGQEDINSPGTTYSQAGYCRLDEHAENILGPGTDWNLGDKGITPFFMGTGTTPYDNPYRPDTDTALTPWNDMSVVTHTSNGTALATGYWPNRLFYELYKMVYAAPTTTTSTNIGCIGDCENKINVYIKIYKDVDQDCVYDSNEPLAAHVTLIIEDPSGNITAHTTGVSGSINLLDIEAGIYIINGKTCDLSNPCTDYSIDIPLYEKTFTSTEVCIMGCTDPTAINYNPLATIDDGSCQIEGCLNDCAINYNSSANIADGSCCPCLELQYIVEDSVRNYAHEITLTLEWPLNSSNFGGNNSATPPGSTLAAGLSTSTYGSPLVIYQETFIYDPLQGIIGPNGAILGMHDFSKILDHGNLILDPGSCELGSYCWIVRWFCLYG